MSSSVVTNIGELVTNDPAAPDLLGIHRDAAVVIEADRVVWVGPALEAPAADTYLDAGGRAVIPGFVDSHAHLVFAGDRAPEFAARMAGTPYAAGGIRTTVAATRAATDEELTGRVARLVAEMRRQGTTRPAAWPSRGNSPTTRRTSARTSSPRAATRGSTSSW